MPTPAIPVVPLPVYPTMDSLASVLELAKVSLPILSSNEITNLLCTYHNTLLAELEKDGRLKPLS